MLTGDALFIGDVGRPDLLASIGVTADELGRLLYDSIQRKLMGLPDAVRVFPAHGAGSACGKNLSTERQSTIGEQRLLNYACQPMSEDEFLAIVTAGQPAAPDYFVYDAILNRKERDGARRRPGAAAAGRRRRRRARAPAAPSWSTPATPRSSPPATCADRSTSRRTAGSPRPRAWCCSPHDAVVVIAPEGREEEIVRPAGPDRLRPRRRLPAERRAHAPRAPGATSAGQPAHPDRSSTRSWTADDAPVLVDVRNAGELRRRAPSRARCTSRWPSCAGAPARSRRPAGGRSTAPAAGARWARACCGPRASPTCPTCWAATAPGCSGQPQAS